MDTTQEDAALGPHGDVPKSMTAVVVRGYGGPDVLEAARLPVPAPGRGEALVAVEACGIGAWDVKRRSGAFGGTAPADLVLGNEIAGTVVALGEQVAGVEVGQRVFAYAPSSSGGNAEYLTCPAEVLAPAPSSLSAAEAAAAPVGALTAQQTLVDTLDVRPGETVVITGGAGGMGSFAVQLAARLGARVIATARAEDREYLAGLDAPTAIDYRGDWVADVRAVARDGADALLDCVGGDTFARAPEAVRDGGRICTLIPVALPDPPPRAIAMHAFGTRPDAAQLTALAERFDRGELRVPLHEAFPLAEARRAHELLEHGHVRGKLALVTATSPTPR